MSTDIALCRRTLPETGRAVRGADIVDVDVLVIPGDRGLPVIPSGVPRPRPPSRPSTETGARRVLNGVFHETLLELDANNRHIRYSIDQGPGPLETVSGYVGRIDVVPVTATEGSEQTAVVWASDWESEEGGVQDFCDPIYQALLGDLKAHFG